MKVLSAMRGARSILSLGVIVGVVFALLANLDGDRDPRAAPRREHLLEARLTIPRGAWTRPIPRSFFGVSTEYWSIPLFAPDSRLLLRVLALLHAQGNGPLVIRIGGDSADHSMWLPSARSVPHWMFRLTPAWLRLTADLLRRADARLIEDLNLVTGSPSEAAALVSATKRALPRGTILGLEIGNEPDIYSRSYWLATTASSGYLLPSAITASTYSQAYDLYAGALTRGTPRVALLGPALARPNADRYWIATLLAAPHPGLGIVTAHYYAFSGCAAPGRPSSPTVARLLDQPLSMRMVQAMAPTIALVHRAGLRFRLSELNSVNCGGRRGVSNTFADALWAPNVLFELLREGVDGINLHIRTWTINAPFVLAGGRLVARPLLYGLILFVRAIGPDGRIIQTRLSSPASSDLAAWAVEVRGPALHVLLIDAGRRPAKIVLHLPTRGPATIERLLAPSPRSTTGVTLGGQRLGTDGGWKGSPSSVSIPPGRHGYTVRLSAASAALFVARLPTSARN
jgi:hypothetical protein